MNALEPIAYLVATDPAFHAHLSHAEVPEAARGPALTESERELVARLRPLLTLPAGVLLQRLLDDGLDGPQRWWNALVFPAQPVP